MEQVLYINDGTRYPESASIVDQAGRTLWSKLQFINEDSGEESFKPLHNRTVIAGAGLSLQKIFGLDRSCLNNTPTYDSVLELDDASNDYDYPAVNITDSNKVVIGSIPDETQRIICGFCVGSGGAGNDPVDVFHENYASWIIPDNLVPFRYTLESSDTTDESIYKGKKTITLSNGQVRNAYYFKEFSNTPQLVQNYTSDISSYNEAISPSIVYQNTTRANQAQSFVELHLRINRSDCREYFITHSGLENAKINQISLVVAWKKNVSRTKIVNGVTTNTTIEALQQIRPFSICNFPTIILDTNKSISIIYTLYC